MCERCEALFNYKKSLNRHVANVHKEKKNIQISGSRPLALKSVLKSLQMKKKIIQNEDF